MAQHAYSFAVIIILFHVTVVENFIVEVFSMVN